MRNYSCRIPFLFMIEDISNYCVQSLPQFLDDIFCLTKNMYIKLQCTMDFKCRITVQMNQSKNCSLLMISKRKIIINMYKEH